MTCSFQSLLASSVKDSMLSAYTGVRHSPWSHDHVGSHLMFTVSLFCPFLSDSSTAALPVKKKKVSYPDLKN